ncbi:Hypothetical predicted protein [Cloeon dipterum]|uniref:ATP synthase subunit s, mitochondrial n=1 Tax=Cloeon dipterum TaxID=197152 RepID=A0A8S1C9G1_9INSE|nr:Hypothetical predicted protein [Cloeon dipterum]
MMSYLTMSAISRQRRVVQYLATSSRSYNAAARDKEPVEQSNTVDNQYYKWRKPWTQVDGYQPSQIELFFPHGANVNFLKIMQKKYDFSLKGFMNWVEKMKLNREKFRQRYIPERHRILGPDLATAHFIVFRGGSVRFHNGKKWIKEYEDENMNLPSKFVPDVHLEAVDASNINLMYHALQNFVFLEKLKWLSFANNKYLDDWFLDKLSGEFNALEYLDISGCKRVTHKGISILHRLENLKELHVADMSSEVEFKLACLSLQESKPQLEIRGLDLSDAEGDENKN